MNSLKRWVIQLRYPYTAGLIAIIWIGSTWLAIIRPEIPGETLLLLVGVATLIVALVGFSSSKH